MRLLPLLLAACHATRLSPCVARLDDFCEDNPYRDCDRTFEAQVEACSWGDASTGACGGLDFVDCADGYASERYFYRDGVLIGVATGSDDASGVCRGDYAWGDVPAACR